MKMLRFYIFTFKILNIDHMFLLIKKILTDLLIVKSQIDTKFH